MEIERKFLIKSLPDNLESYSCDTLIQAYISTEPVIRVRQKNEDYILTLKSAGLLAREEIEMPLTEESFKHLLSKKDGISIKKKRYKIFLYFFKISIIFLKKQKKCQNLSTKRKKTIDFSPPECYNQR